MRIISTIAVADHAAYMNAVACAERRALHSYFDQHVLEEDDGVYVAVDEGDYSVLPSAMVDRIVHTVPGAMHDEF